VSPLEVENCLREHPAVWKPPLSERSEKNLVKPKAFVVLNKVSRISGTRKGIETVVLDRLAKFKYPRWIVFMDELPRRPPERFSVSNSADLILRSKI
jgi:benzoate-CoA ligase